MKKDLLSNFFANQQLYHPLLITDNYVYGTGYESPVSFRGITFPYYCSNEEAIRTFELEIPETSIDFWASKIPGNQIKEVLNEGKLDFIQHLIGKCLSCKKYHINFLLHVWSTKVISTDLFEAQRFGAIRSNSDTPKNAEDLNTVYIEKVGISPEHELKVDKELTKYFSREASSWYFKGKKALSQNLGIGAFAYFRRVIEKELFSIVTDISKLNSSDSDKINSLIIDYNKHGKVYPLYENVFNYLPKSLQSLGDNPLEVLYRQTSQGLHNITEQDCLERASQIDLILTFVIKKINEEKSDILDVRNAMKSLKSPNS